MTDGHEHDDLTKLTDEIADKVARRLIEGAYHISPRHADYLAQIPGSGVAFLGGSYYPVRLEYHISNGQIRLDLRTATDEVMWRGTLRCDTEFGPRVAELSRT